MTEKIENPMKGMSFHHKIVLDFTLLNGDKDSAKFTQEGRISTSFEYHPIWNNQWKTNAFPIEMGIQCNEIRN